MFFLLFSVFYKLSRTSVYFGNSDKNTYVIMRELHKFERNIATERPLGVTKLIIEMDLELS